jgi:inorganic triphosphatase YgiF
MATEIEFKYSLENPAEAGVIANSDYVTQYLRDDWTERSTLDVYYDTDNWDLAERNALLRVRAWINLSIATLKFGSFKQEGHPGLYRGENFSTIFHGVGPVMRELIDHGAPESFADIAGAKLSPAYEYKCTRRFATLYLPEMTRVELSFDEGVLTVGDKSVKTCEMTLELLFGPVSELEAYCERLVTEHRLEPHKQTKQETALRLLRSK